MPAPEQTTGSLRSRTSVSDLLRALQARRDVIVHQRDGYLDVRASDTGAVGLFAHPDRVAIAVPPSRGYELAVQRPFAILIPRTPVIAFVVVHAHDVAAYFDDVLTLAVEAVDWRACARTPEFCARCGVGCVDVRDPCPNCWLEVDSAGHCGCGAPLGATS